MTTKVGRTPPHGAAGQKYLFLLGSTRAGSNSEALARAAARSLPTNALQRWIRVIDHPTLEPFEDRRHADPYRAYPMPEGVALNLLEATLEATDIVIATPLYWYGLPGHLKLYLDHWSAWMRVPGLNFRERMQGKALHLIVAHGEEPEKAAPLVAAMKYAAQFMGMRWGGELLAQGNRPGEALEGFAAGEAASRFFGPAAAVEERVSG
ncbi:NAD(P)H-dependent FMN reductase [Deinobacterium chartae]|uniref:NAD(P)H-dependent FMN reductase n=1 Tax=Deinobacterium chartae TaxID=521158 RepID=A0A841I3V2_9DEIO|nr:NAD(P)H-dependent oxidoreductase [Deinobacterium chartae]MBB6099058.1 NAD(P)H-dependent FMN reductase [Deinobacterium chartae]